MKLNAATCTSTSTWPGPRTGSASSPYSSASMPSKLRQMTARMSAQPFHAHRDDLGCGARRGALAHAAGHDRLALTVLDDARTQFQRLGHPGRLEVVHVQAAS